MRLLGLPIFACQFLSALSNLRLGCDRGSVPAVFTNDPLKPVLACGASTCLAAANVTCEASGSACTARHQWMRSVILSSSAPPIYTCCRSPQVLRSSLQRTVPVLPSHSAFMRGFEVAAQLAPDVDGREEDVQFQFGEMITRLQFDPAGVSLMEVARFKCGRAAEEPEYPQYGDYNNYRRKRNVLIEPLDKPACDSEWDATEVVQSLHGHREGRAMGSLVSRVTDLSFCGVEVRPSSQAFLTF